MLINIPIMKGEIPRLRPHLLQAEAAVIAQDCHFENGIISPLLVDLFHKELPIEPTTIFKYKDDEWFCWKTDVDAIHNPMAQDEWMRVYFTGDGKPKVTAQDIAIGSVSPSASYDLGVPAPDSAPMINKVDDSTGIPPPEGEPEIFDDETRYYVQTFVTRFGEEGPPSPPSEKLIVEKPGSTVYVGLSRLNSNTHNITHTRLYRTVTSSVGAEYMLVAELPISQAEYIDSAQTINGPIIETWDYDLPDENMIGLCVMANGICAGFAGNEVMFSEAYLPYSWPKQYRGTTEHQIVGIKAIGTSLVVATEGYPYVFTGVTPSAVNGTKITSEQACVSKASMVVVNGVVMYASPDGIVAVGGDGAITITDQLMTRSQWQVKKPETLRAWASEGLYVALHDGGGFIFDPVSKDFRQITNQWNCAYSDLERDQLFIVKKKMMNIWQGGEQYLKSTWRSKVFQMPVDSLMSCARVVSPNIEKLSISIIADGQVIHTLATGSVPKNGFRLPPVRATNWQVEVKGDEEVERLVIASSMQELM